MWLSKSTPVLGQHTKFLINFVGIILYDMVAGTVKNECALQLDRKVPVTGTAYVIWATQQQQWNV
jgi:hypothetical protein